MPARRQLGGHEGMPLCALSPCPTVETMRVLLRRRGRGRRMWALAAAAVVVAQAQGGVVGGNETPGGSLGDQEPFRRGDVQGSLDGISSFRPR